jgi:hypothetical protein
MPINLSYFGLIYGDLFFRNSRNKADAIKDQLFFIIILSRFIGFAVRQTAQTPEISERR